MRRTVSLFVLAALVTGFAIINHGCSRSGAMDADDRDDSLGFDLNDPKLRERLGDDDGYTFAIMYGADVHGSLETCG